MKGVCLLCPASLQAWALFEAKRGNRSRMRKLFARALAAKPDSTYTFQVSGQASLG